MICKGHKVTSSTFSWDLLSFVCKMSTQTRIKAACLSWRLILRCGVKPSRLFHLRSFIFALVSDAPLFTCSHLTHCSGDKTNTPGMILGLCVILNMHNLPPRLATSFWFPSFCLLKLSSRHRRARARYRTALLRIHSFASFHHSKQLTVWRVSPASAFFSVTEKTDWSAAVLLINLSGFEFKKGRRRIEWVLSRSGTHPVSEW